jgi:hypothetical protein
MTDDRPKPKDSMPRYFKEMEKHGLKITSFSQLKKDRPRGCYFKIVTLNINAI